MVSVFFDMVGLAYWPMRNVTRQPIQHGPDELNQVVPKPTTVPINGFPMAGGIRLSSVRSHCCTIAEPSPPLIQRVWP